MPNSRRSKIILIAIAVIVVLIIGLGAAGYRIDRNFHLVKTGVLIVRSLPSDTKIFIDGTRRGLTNQADDFTVRLSPGTHSVLVSKPNYWPWLKAVEIKSGTSNAIFPFVIPQNPRGEIVTAADPEYYKLLNIAKLSKAPGVLSGSEPKSESESSADWVKRAIPDARISDDSKVALWLSGDTIKAAWLGSSAEDNLPTFCKNTNCLQTVDVFASPLAITNIEFLKGRNDVVVFGSGDGLFAIEFDKNSTQNFEPVYEERNLKFFRGVDGLYLLTEKGALLHLSL